MDLTNLNKFVYVYLLKKEVQKLKKTKIFFIFDFQFKYSFKITNRLIMANNILIVGSGKRKKQANLKSLLILIRELELAIALSSVFTPSQSKQLEAAIIKLVKQLP